MAPQMNGNEKEREKERKKKQLVHNWAYRALWDDYGSDGHWFSGFPHFHSHSHMNSP